MVFSYSDSLTVYSQNKEIIYLKERLDKVEKEFRKYRNENTPSSANKHLKGNTNGLRAKGGKRGAPFGHKGTTRKQVPDEFDNIDANECPGCHSDDIEDVDLLKRFVEEVPAPVRPKATGAGSFFTNS